MHEIRDKRYKINSFLVNSHLHELSKVSKSLTYILINKILLGLYILNFVKLCIFLMFNIDNSIKHLLFNLSKFIGAIEKYNIIIFITAMVLGFYMILNFDI